jgi:hypothetical protein
MSPKYSAKLCARNLRYCFCAPSRVIPEMTMRPEQRTRRRVIRLTLELMGFSNENRCSPQTLATTATVELTANMSSDPHDPA